MQSMILLLFLMLQINSKMIELYDSDKEGADASGVCKICNPFLGAPNYSYISEKCPNDTIPIGDLPNVSSLFLRMRYRNLDSSQYFNLTY